MEGKENQGDKMDISIIEDEDVSTTEETTKDEPQQEPPAKKAKPAFEYLNTRMDSLETRLHAIGDKLKIDTRGMMKKCFERKENSPLWSGNEVVASAISRVRKLEKSETSDLEDSVGVKAAKIPRLDIIPEPVASTSSWVAPEMQSPLEGSSFESHDVSMTSIPIWESRQFKDRQDDIPNMTGMTSPISSHTWSSSDFTLSPDDEDFSLPTDDEDFTLTPDEDREKSNSEQLASAFDKLTCNTQCLVPQLKSPEEGSKVPVTVKCLARDLFNSAAERDLTGHSSDDHDLSGIEPIVDDFSSFSETSADQVGVLVDDLIGSAISSAISSTIDSYGGERFTHSTPVRQSIASRVRQLERELFTADDDSLSSLED